MSAENPEWDHDVEVAGTTYHVYFDQNEMMVPGIDCPKHPGETANMTSLITIHEINDQGNEPLPDGTDVEALKTKILEKMGHGVKQCHQCHVEEEANLL